MFVILLVLHLLKVPEASGNFDLKFLSLQSNINGSIWMKSSYDLQNNSPIR